MPIVADCGGCRQTFRVVDSLAGRRVNCPGCKAPVQIPTATRHGDAPDDNVKPLASKRRVAARPRVERSQPPLDHRSGLAEIEQPLCPPQLGRVGDAGVRLGRGGHGA